MRRVSRGLPRVSCCFSPLVSIMSIGLLSLAAMVTGMLDLNDVDIILIMADNLPVAE